MFSWWLEKRWAETLAVAVPDDVLLPGPKHNFRETCPLALAVRRRRSRIFSLLLSRPPEDLSLWNNRVLAIRAFCEELKDKTPTQRDIDERQAMLNEALHRVNLYRLSVSDVLLSLLCPIRGIVEMTIQYL